MPLSTRRSSTRCLPRTLVGNSGSMRAHCASENQKKSAIFTPPDWPAMNHKRIVLGTRLMGPDPNHAVEYANGQAHTNTIEGFWALVKRAWYGSHHHYSRKYMPLYISEACFKYNRRKQKCAFDGSL